MEKHDRLSRTSPAFRQALAQVRRMSDAGMVTVPADPTLRMALAGARAGRIRVLSAVSVWRAMVRESLK